MKKVVALYIIIVAMFSCGTLFGADIQYAFTLNWSAIPNPIQFKKVTFRVNLGTCTSATVAQDGVPLSCTYSATTKDVIFTASNNSTNILVTGINNTVAGTGAISKCILYEDKRWAYSFTFDDSYTTQNTVAWPIFKAKNYRGGIGLIRDADTWGGGYLSWAQLDQLHNDGWSIMDHSVGHVHDVAGGASLIKCPGDPDYNPSYTIATEVKPCKDAIEARYPGYIVTNYVYPYNDIAYQACLTSSGLFQSAEAGIHDNYADTIPTVDERFNLGRQQFYGTDITTFNTWPTDAYTDSVNNNKHRWLITFTHGVESGNGTPSSIYFTNSATLQAHVNYIYTNYGDGGNKSMWFAPTDEVFNYLLCRDYITATSSIVGSPTASPTITRTYTVTPTATATMCGEVNVYRVNCGGSTFNDSFGKTWAADQAYGSGWGYQNGTVAVASTADILNTTDDKIYQTETYGSGLTYKFAVSSAGNYKVRLLFAEIYYDTAAQRVFSVYIEGTKVINNLDIFTAAGGANKPYEQTFTVSVTDGEVTINTTTTTDLPKISGIEITKITACNTATITPAVSKTPTPTMTKTATSTATITMTATKTATITITTTIGMTATITLTATVTPTNDNTVISPTVTPTLQVPQEKPSKYIESVTVYPNPSDKIAIVKYYLNGEATSAQVVLYTKSFRKIYSAAAGTAYGDNFLELPLEKLQLSNGTYFYLLAVKPADKNQETKTGTLIRIKK